MKLSKKGEYALRSLINLGFAAEAKRDLVQASELAESEQLPVKFLEQILQVLKEAGFVKSAAGSSAATPWPSRRGRSRSARSSG